MRALRVLQERSATAMRERVSAALELSRGRGGSALARAVFLATDEEAERVLAGKGAARPACASGCASCCHVHVEATPAEIDAAVESLRASRSESELSGLAARLYDTVALSLEERWEARAPCAFLATDRTCSIHVVRPLRCRAFHSYEADACRDAFARRSLTEPPQSAALTRAYDAAEEAFDVALARDGEVAPTELLEAGVLRRLEAFAGAWTNQG